MKKTSGKFSALRNISKAYYTIIGTIILGITIVHFSFQMSFIQNENLQAVETAVENKAEIAPPVKQVIEIEPEQYEVKKVKVITLPEFVKPAPPRQKESVPAPRKSVRKKEVRETRAERLRRAERILTGV